MSTIKVSAILRFDRLKVWPWFDRLQENVSTITRCQLYSTSSIDRIGCNYLLQTRKNKSQKKLELWDQINLWEIKCLISVGQVDKFKNCTSIYTQFLSHTLYIRFCRDNITLIFSIAKAVICPPISRRFAAASPAF